MIIHIWMHWFWITTTYFKGFLFFAMTQMISFTFIFQSYAESVAEAGLLEHEIIAPVSPYSYDDGNSSQVGRDPNITLTIEKRNHPSETAVHEMSSSDPLIEASAEGSTTSKAGDSYNIAFGSTSDVEDTYNGETLDVFHHPMKKFSKYSHLKYGKAKAKGKPIEEAGEEEQKPESGKVVEKKDNVNVSLRDDGMSRLRWKVEKSNESLSEEQSTEVPTSVVPDLIITTFAENVTSEDIAETESVSKNEPNVTVDSSTAASGIPLFGKPKLTENQREVEVLKNETLVIESKVEESRPFTTEPFAVKNRVAAATSAQNYEVEQSYLNAGSITGITLGILVIFSLFGAVSFVLYRRRYLNKPQVFHDKCSNLDSSGYIDETSLKENSEEMYSLDNDSFLNSLEAMTIQNYWTENVKHTKL